MQYKHIFSLMTALAFSANIHADNHAQTIIKSHGIAMSGEIKYGKEQHFDYINPYAPKAGAFIQSWGWTGGTYDSLNPFILKGIAAAGLDLIYDTLMTTGMDEPFSVYGLLAETVEYPEDRTWIIFHLNPKAKFSDGKPVTAGDVVFSFNQLISKGHPWYRSYYRDVVSVKEVGERSVRFDFNKESKNREMPLIVGGLTVNPSHHEAAQNYDGQLIIPIGSGPYQIKSFERANYIEYELDPNYWGKDLAVNKGRYNFKTMKYIYFKDNYVALEALKAGDVNFHYENSSKQWATQVKGTAFDDGRLTKDFIKHTQPRGMQAFFMNLRKPLFQDREFRRAMTLAWDFEWTNKVIFYDAYIRHNSYFDNSELATDLKNPPKGEELALLEQVKQYLPKEILTQGMEIPKTDGSGANREGLLEAAMILKKAGYKIKNSQLLDKEGNPIKLEIPITGPGWNRIILPFAENLKKLGITLTIKQVDRSQLKEITDSHSYDMMIYNYGQGISPGSEQIDRFTSSSKDVKGSSNWIGLANPGIDFLVNQVVGAKNREDLVIATRALDRALMWGWYVIPHYYIDSHRVAYTTEMTRPQVKPYYGFDWNSMYMKNNKE